MHNSIAFLSAECRRPAVIRRAWASHRARVRKPAAESRGRGEEERRGGGAPAQPVGRFPPARPLAPLSRAPPLPERGHPAPRNGKRRQHGKPGGRSAGREAGFSESPAGRRGEGAAGARTGGRLPAKPGVRIREAGPKMAVVRGAPLL